MRIVLQRVSQASVSIAGNSIASIGSGLLLLVGIEEADTQDDIEWLTGKVIRLRVFPDDDGVMNKPVTEADGEILVVSQFTLHASIKKGNRPSYIRAARPETAIPLYTEFVRSLEKMLGKPVQTGDFGAMMEVFLVNDGPVTLIIDSKNRE
ncbi:MAG: D-tyrosyl-tRNA(Tyr) deacylase [Bacteroidales bacterium]|nr:D-tyrosyl-tRNA(Tyr) deacylase [Bacteroidales bacterium]